MKNEITTSGFESCPFCGSEKAEVVHVWAYHNDYHHRVKCPRCGAETEVFVSEREAVAAWNRRAGEGGKP